MRRIRFFIIASVLASTVHAQPGGQVLFSSKTDPGVSCYRIPAMVTASNGDLVVAADQRVASCDDLRGNRDINIVIRTSTDNGDTWSDIRTVVDYPLGCSASDPSLITDHVTGEIFLFYNYMDLDRERDVYYFKVIRSKDNGKTWSPPQDITSLITPGEWEHDFKFITSGEGARTKSGKLIHTLVNLNRGVYLFASDDHGGSWYLIDQPLPVGDESKVIELDDGTWMVNSRVNGSGCRYVHISADEGKTWMSKPDTTLADPGCNASLLRKGDTLLFSNPDHKKERKNLTIRMSIDNGKTWMAGTVIHAGNSAYSTMTLLATGEVGILYERNDYSELVFTRITL